MVFNAGRFDRVDNVRRTPGEIEFGFFVQQRIVFPDRFFRIGGWNDTECISSRGRDGGLLESRNGSPVRCLHGKTGDTHSPDSDTGTIKSKRGLSFHRVIQHCSRKCERMLLPGVAVLEINPVGTRGFLYIRSGRFVVNLDRPPAPVEVADRDEKSSSCQCNLVGRGFEIQAIVFGIRRGRDSQIAFQRFDGVTAACGIHHRQTVSAFRTFEQDVGRRGAVLQHRHGGAATRRCLLLGDDRGCNNAEAYDERETFH